LSNIGLAELKGAAADVKIAWKPEWESALDFDDPELQKILESAEADLTVIGHTTLKNGAYVNSEGWTVSDLPTPELTPAAEQVATHYEADWLEDVAALRAGETPAEMLESYLDCEFDLNFDTDDIDDCHEFAIGWIEYTAEIAKMARNEAI
jgi:hypothetical protein